MVPHLGPPMTGGIQGAGRYLCGGSRGGGSWPSSLSSSWDIMGVCKVALLGGATMPWGGVMALGVEPVKEVGSDQSGAERDRRVEAIPWSGGVEVAAGPSADTRPGDI